MTYLGDGRLVARALFLHRFSDYYGMRSFIYSLGILPWHWNITPWPIVFFQSGLTAYVIWLVMRSILPRHLVSRYLIVLLALSVSTSLSWYVSLILPDILGPVLYLCIYLLVFARGSLSRAENIAIGLIAWWAIASHATHLMLAVGLCMLLAVFLFVRRRANRGPLTGLGEVVIIVLLAASAQLALHAYLFGELSLNGDRPPFLTARIIADGPGRWYLQKHCGEVKFAICGYVHNLPDDPDTFLWGDNGVWQNASDETEQQMLKEEVPFVLATVREYPLQELSKGASNFGQQLITFGLWDLDPSDWVLQQFDATLPGGKSSYLKSLQSRNALPFDFFDYVHTWTMILSLSLLLTFTALLWRHRPTQLIGLTIVVIPAVVANAAITGTLSMVEERFQARVIWLLPFLASMALLCWLEQRKTKVVNG
jgi:hypothetical protein